MYKKIILTSLMISCVIWVNASIMIYPKYVFIDDKTKSSEILLINGDATQISNYRIRLSYKTQNQDGSYTEITDANLMPADNAIPLLRYSPRSVELAPQQSQTVRLLKRLPEGLPAGDYIAYITFTEVVQEPPRKPADENAKGISIQITPIPSFSIPIVIHHGEIKTNVPTLQVSKLRYINNKTYLPVRLQRTAKKGIPNTIIRGDISVWYRNQLLGQIKGKYLLPKTEFVDVNVALSQENRLKLRGKKVKVLFTQYSESKIDKKNILAEVETVL